MAGQARDADARRRKFHCHLPQHFFFFRRDGIADVQLHAEKAAVIAQNSHVAGELTGFFILDGDAQALPVAFQTDAFRKRANGFAARANLYQSGEQKADRVHAQLRRGGMRGYARRRELHAPIAQIFHRKARLRRFFGARANDGPGDARHHVGPHARVHLIKRHLARIAGQFFGEKYAQPALFNVDHRILRVG